MLIVNWVQKEKIMKWFKEHPRRKKVRIRAGDKVFVLWKKDLEKYEGRNIILDVKVES